MIITCEKCSKKFNIEDNLIPAEGRQLQCGSCNYSWFFINQKKTIKLDNEVDNISNTDNKVVTNIHEIKNSNDPINIEKKNKNKIISNHKNIKEVKKNQKIIKNSLVFIISITAIIILLDTFKYQLNNYIPGLNSVLNNLYETLKDLLLFFKDLVN